MVAQLDAGFRLQPARSIQLEEHAHAHNGHTHTYTHTLLVHADDNCAQRLKEHAYFAVRTSCSLPTSNFEGLLKVCFTICQLLLPHAEVAPIGRRRRPVVLLFGSHWEREKATRRVERGVNQLLRRNRDSKRGICRSYTFKIVIILRVITSNLVFVTDNIRWTCLPQ